MANVFVTETNEKSSFGDTDARSSLQDLLSSKKKWERLKSCAVNKMWKAKCYEEIDDVSDENINENEVKKDESHSGDFKTNEEETINYNVDQEEVDFNSLCSSQTLLTLEELANSQYLYNRQLAARKILEALQQAGSDEKEIQSVVSVMCKLSEDEECTVQFELMQHVPDIASYCHSEPNLHIVIRQQLIPFIVKLLNDVQVLIRRSGQSALLVLLEKRLVEESQMIEWVFPLVAQLVLCESNAEELRIEDVTLMIKIIPLVGEYATQHFFLNPYMALCVDSLFEIRRICAAGFGTMCQVSGLKVTEICLLPCFLNLCNDIMWGVRKACAKVFVDVANCVLPETRKEVLPHIFVNLLTDNSFYVKFSAYQNLGAFIYSFANPDKTGCTLENGEILVSNQLKDFKSNPDMLNQNSYDRPWSKNLTIYNSNESHLLTSQFQDFSLTSYNHENSLDVVKNEGNENLYNNFQFWRMPLPELELDINNSCANGNQISTNATPIETASTISIASNQYSNTRNVDREQSIVKTANINTLSAQDQLLDDDTEMLHSSFKEAVLTFKSEPEELVKGALISKLEENMLTTTNNQNNQVLSPNDQDIVPPVLLSSFVSVVNNYTFEMSKLYDDDTLGYIAYSFPAVALTLGRKYWPCIKKTCEMLARNIKWSVRRTIASSLHELASILGYDIIMSDLHPIFMDLFKDVDEVRLSLVQHLSEFLEHLSQEDRKKFLPLFEEFSKVDNDKNWRFRHAVAEQLSKTADLYDALDIKEYFLPVASTLLHDKVATVRQASVQLMAVLLKHMHLDKRTESFYQTMLEGFDVLYRQSHKWVWRQTYIMLCEQIVLERSMEMPDFVDTIAPKLFSLSYDKVPNVRLVLVRCIASTLLANGDFISCVLSTSNVGYFREALESLNSDSDNDVRYIAERFNVNHLLVQH